MENPDADLSHQCPGVARLLALLMHVAVMGWLPSFFFFFLDGHESTIKALQVHGQTRGGFHMCDKPRVRTYQDSTVTAQNPELG